MDKKNNETEIPLVIGPAKDIYEVFENPAVHKALEFVFRSKSDEFKRLVSDEEYAVFGRAYWHLAIRFSETWGVKNE